MMNAIVFDEGELHTKLYQRNTPCSELTLVSPLDSKLTKVKLFHSFPETIYRKYVHSDQSISPRYYTTASHIEKDCTGRKIIKKAYTDEELAIKKERRLKQTQLLMDTFLQDNVNEEDKSCIIVKGGTGSIALGLTEDNTFIAIKKIKSPKAGFVNEVLNQHNSSSGLIGIAKKEDGSKYIGMPLLHNYVSVKDFILNRQQKIDFDLILAIMKACLVEINSLHKKNIKHGDTAGSNIMISTDSTKDNIKLKMIDYGSSESLQDMSKQQKDNACYNDKTSFFGAFDLLIRELVVEKSEFNQLSFFSLSMLKILWLIVKETRFLSLYFLIHFFKAATGILPEAEWVHRARDK